jgi:hypothetical protein
MFVLIAEIIHQSRFVRFSSAAAKCAIWSEWAFWKAVRTVSRST